MRSSSSFLHLIDGDGAITAPATVARFLAEAMGADPRTIPSTAAAGSAGNKKALNSRAAPSIPALRERGFNYRVVGVFGGQSTGKSTLLNLLFGTRFQTMNSEEGRSQTTLGCFIGKAIPDTNVELPPSATSDLFVMDFEGTDGVERGENQSLEKQLSLFALSVADTLIVNMFAHEVGRFNAANLSLLQTVFEVNLQLLSHESRGAASGADVVKPTLLFVLRDHTDGPVQKLQDGIVKSLEGIWSKIGKPASFADSNIRDFFNMSFCALPHYKLQRPQFDAAVDDLRRWFWDVRCPAYLYKGVGQDNYRHIALDDVADYLANCWHSIQTVKDLDIPTQREMLALVRCQEVSDVLASEHEADIVKRLGRLRDGVFIPNISGWIRAVIRQRQADFAAQTGHYASNVTKAATAELQRRLEQAAQPLHEGQCKSLCDALVRASGDRVGAVLDMAFNSVLPRLATEWFSKIETARNAAAAAAQNDDEVTRNVKIADAQRRVKVAGSVKKFWDFIKAELEVLQEMLQNQIATSNVSSPTDRASPADDAAASRSGTPVDPSADPSSSLNKLLQCLRGDDEAMQRTFELVRSTLYAQVLRRLQLVASDLSASMTKAFDRHISKNVDGTVRFLTTTKGLRKAFGPARAAGLLLAACIAVYRLGDSGHSDEDSCAADPAVATLLERWAADAMQLDFDIDENPSNLIGAPIYPSLPTPPVMANLKVVRRDDDDDDDGAAAVTGGGASDAGNVALRIFKSRVIADRDCLERAIGLYFQQCTFTFTLQTKQIEAGSTSAPLWMWLLILLLGANEIVWLLTNPLMLIFLCAAMWFFCRNWVEAQWQKFVETGPAQLVLPAQAALAWTQRAYDTHVAPRLGGPAPQANARGKPKAE